ncbi:SRPBCC family protein [Chondromyces crocatus]|uniref:Vanillate O-demethylase oxidoreductase VanB n=1 Tax=Chondromyces crocatus TaxID=52 RepID=A0A0K1EQV3_CHOCO|nr:SRPBCC family protein [Chondromyces crocatus]AKT43305.1 vanillate O-demethylase oxidoreductase VanB [Chondromyces crocatus]
MTSPTDRIEKKVHLRAPRERVWRAISRSAEFGTWFGMQVDGEFAPHTTLGARIVPTQVDPEVAEKQKAFDGAPFELYIEQMEPMRLFSFRWHPYTVEKQDYGTAPTTLVVFELEDADGGTLLTVSESGFDEIPLERRAKAFADNEGGWAIQTQLIARYLAHAGG